jgi:hypothetical protein
MPHSHTHAAPAVAPVTTSRELTIAKTVFTIADRYGEGHILTAAEANAMNATLADAVRNGFAPRLKKMREEKASDEVIAKALAEYSANYIFGARRVYTRGGDAATSAINKIALAIAKEYVRKKLLAKGLSTRSAGDEKITALAKEALIRLPKIVEEATRRYNETLNVDLGEELFDL